MSYCQCKKCEKSVPPDINKDLRCEICGRKQYFRFAWSPGIICDGCWLGIPEYIPEKHRCTFFRLKVKKLENEVKNDR